MRDIKYKAVACGPTGSFQPGDVRHGVPDDEAFALIRGGYADDVTPREQATVAPIERAVSPAQPGRHVPPQRRGR